jgi:hypothetical protein
VVKLALPLYYGSTYQLLQLPQKGVRKGVRRLSKHGLASSMFLNLLDEEGAYSDTCDATAWKGYFSRDSRWKKNSKLSEVDVTASALHIKDN